MEEGRRATGKGGSEMVESELEAAEALADLASTEFPPPHFSVSDRTAALCLSPDTMDEAVGAPRQCENTYSIALNKKGNIDQDAESHKPNATCSRSHTYINGNRSRHKLTEDEKEARRIRRVLANRESARQTIRRRQALYEELISKAASLAQENDSLKREMDFAEKEYNSLKTANESLKSQMVKAASTKLDENQPDLKSTNTETSKSTCPSCPLMMYNQTQPFPFMWPAFLQHPNATQSNYENRDVPNPPLYILPCPIFYPVPNHGDRVPLIPSFDSRNDQIATPMSYSYAWSSSTKTAEYGFEEAKGEVASSSKNTHEVPFKIQTGPSVPVKPIPSVKPLTCQPSEFIFTSSNTLDTMKEKKIDLNICPSKKQVDAVAAAEARKTRKDLTKLKIHHLRDLNICPSKKQVDAVAAAEARKTRKELTKLKIHHLRDFRRG